MNKIVVHHLENSRSQRVLWLLEELGLPYEVKRYERDRQTMLAPPELRAVHPLGKSPVITDGDTTVAESGAIVEYLVAKAGALRPAAGTPAALQFTYWLHFAEGTAMPPLVMKLVFDKIQQAKLPFFVKPIAKGIAQKVLSSFVLPNISAQLKFMNETLARQPWFAGDSFSAADVQMSFPLEAAAARGGLDTRHPHLQAWLATIHARPAYQRALKAGGPYDILG
ncbi:MAG: glutathione S-transferase [Rubrivivax sp.]|jgi:glutathione S-transferase